MKKTILIPAMCFILFIITSLSASSQENNLQKKYAINVMFDPTGFITFGPAIYAEPAISNNFSFCTGVRLVNLGLIQNALYGSMEFSYMLNASLRFYTNPKQKIDGFFIGPGGGYGQSNYTSGSKYHGRAFGGELGYKWVHKNRLSLEVSDMIGLVQSKKIDTSEFIYMDPIEYDWETDMFVFYLVSFKIGLLF